MTDINRAKIEISRARLMPGDIGQLSRVVEHLGGFAGRPFKGLLISAMQTGYDRERTRRLAALAKHLSEAEILWLCDNPQSPL